MWSQPFFVGEGGGDGCILPGIFINYTEYRGDIGLYLHRIKESSRPNLTSYH